MQTRFREFLGTKIVHRATLLGVVGSLLALAPFGPLAQVAHATTGAITEYRPAGLTQGTTASDPLGITFGPDGNIWYTDAGENVNLSCPSAPTKPPGTDCAPPDALGTMKPDGTGLTTFPDYASIVSVPTALANGKDVFNGVSEQGMWFSNFSRSATDVGSIDTAGFVNHYNMNIPTSTPTDIVQGPDGRMWFAENGNGYIGAISTDGQGTQSHYYTPGAICGVVTTPATPACPNGVSPVTNTSVNPVALAADTGHNLIWATIDGSKSIIAMDMSGNIVHTIGPISSLQGITMGPDGNVWYTTEGGPGNSGNVIGHIDAGTGAALPSFAVPGNSNPNAIITGPDHNLWFIDQGNNTVTRMTTSGTFTAYPVPTANAFSPNVQPTGIAVGRDNQSIWFTENHTPATSPTNQTQGIGRLTIDADVSLSPSPANFGTHLPGTPTPMTITISNPGNPVTLSGETITGVNSGDFTIGANTCGGGLSGNSCTVTVNFNPSATGNRTAVLQVAGTGLGAPWTAVLTGIGQAVAPIFGPANFAFGSQFVGVATKPGNFSVINNTGLPVTVDAAGASLGAPNPADFTIVGNSCGAGSSIPNGRTCTISVAFTPTTLGARSSVLSVSVGGTVFHASLSGTGTPPPPIANSHPGAGYWFAASDGGIFNYGTAQLLGSLGSTHLNKPIVGMARTADGKGYWLVASDGGIFNFGDAKFFGSTGSIHLNQPIVGMAPTPDGQGYWLVASDGGIFNYGTAAFLGSMGGKPLNKPIVGMTSSPDGLGYWMVATDGGIFNFGTAHFFGSTGSIHLNQPIVGMAAAPDGQGYWFAASDGGIFNYGTSLFFGSAGSIHLNKPIVGLASTLDGQGYWMAATDGGIFNYGDARFFGSTGSIHLNQPVVALAVAI